MYSYVRRADGGPGLGGLGGWVKSHNNHDLLILLRKRLPRMLEVNRPAKQHCSVFSVCVCVCTVECIYTYSTEGHMGVMRSHHKSRNCCSQKSDLSRRIRCGVSVQRESSEATKRTHKRTHRRTRRGRKRRAPI